MFSVFVAYFIVDICFSCLRCARACVLMNSLGLHVMQSSQVSLKKLWKIAFPKKNFRLRRPGGGGSAPHTPPPLARGSAPRSRSLLLLETLYVNLNILQHFRDFSRFFPAAETAGRGVDFQDCENLPLVKIEILSKFSNLFLQFDRKSRFNFIFCDNIGSISIGENWSFFEDNDGRRPCAVYCSRWFPKKSPTHTWSIDKTFQNELTNQREHIKKPPRGAFAKGGDSIDSKNL